MSVLHVDLAPKEGSVPALEDTYRERFCPAIRRQPGFVSVGLFRPAEAGRGTGDGSQSWRLVIEFEREQDRIAWTETDLHQDVWGAMEERIRTYQPLVFQEVSAT